MNSNMYIENLYKGVNVTDKDSFVDQTQLDSYIPVVDQDVSRLLSLMIRATNAKDILEIGTSIGYSTVSMANMIGEDGRIVTVDFDKTVAKEAFANFKRNSVDHKIELKIGDAKTVIPSLDQMFDIIFLDVDKRLYEPLLDCCIKKLKPNGMLIAEDTLFPVLDLDPKWHYLIEPIEVFNKAVLERTDIISTILPIGDGVTLITKLPTE